jgi:D-serine deaminase-like pyridoxal phosphate-dependent protein
MNFTRPALLLDKEKCIGNISFMAEKAKYHNLILRPHFKTHQSHTIGKWFRDFGTDKITVSSVSMAEYFAGDGWNDITIAFPFNINEIAASNQLAGKIKLQLTVCSAETLEFIDQNIRHQVGICIKTDTGYNRTGISWKDTGQIEKMLEIIINSRKLSFYGFIVHNGHTYKASDIEMIRSIHDESILALSTLRLKFGHIVPNMVLSTGDTPACSICENFKGIDEIRPGNYVFYDLTQFHLGSCKFPQIAVALAAPLVAKHYERLEIVIYGGAVHLSKEYLYIGDNKIFGQVVDLTASGWSDPLPGIFVTGLSQEHGIIKCDEEFFGRIKVGDFLGIIPVHSCLTADLMKSFVTTQGETADHLSSSNVKNLFTR